VVNRVFNSEIDDVLSKVPKTIVRIPRASARGSRTP
jgi:hypothetical protein